MRGSSVRIRQVAPDLKISMGSWTEVSYPIDRYLRRGISSSGRATALQAVGGRFEPDILHQEH